MEQQRDAPLSESQLGEVAKLANALQRADGEIEELEKKLKEKKKHATHLREEALPGAMEEIGLKQITLENGDQIKIVENVYAAIPKAQEQRAFSWLEDHGFGSLIKSEVTASFGKGEAEQANQAIQFLKEQGYTFKTKEQVHPQTLRAFLKEQLEKGSNIPLDLFGARPVNQAKIIRSK